MKCLTLSVLAAAALSLAATTAQAQSSVLLYSFETGDAGGSIDGFAKNGAGVSTLAQSNIGVTNGSNSLQLTTNTATGFLGALSQSGQANPPEDQLATLYNPNIVAISFDVTETVAYGGTFADLGPTIFMENPGESEFGVQFAPATSEWANVAFLAPGTETVTIPLNGTDPDSGLPQTWNGLLTGNGSAPGWIPTGFEITINKDETAPLNLYIDNIRGILAPEPASLSALSAVGGLLLARRRRS